MWMKQTPASIGKKPIRFEETFYEKNRSGGYID
jgi:hypothetical protein